MELLTKTTKMGDTQQGESGTKQAKVEPNWDVLKDNFMLDAQLKDWDKEGTGVSEGDVAVEKL